VSVVKLPGTEARAEERRVLRADAAERVAYLAKRFGDSGDKVLVGVANVLLCLDWGLRRDDMHGGAVIRIVEENAKVTQTLLGHMARLADEQRTVIVRPNGVEVGVVDKSKIGG
jgi:hypothetical protein